MTQVQPGEVRVGDDERRAVDARLHAAVGEGRLSLLEYEERAGLVWSARTRADLAAVTADLPDAATPAVPALPGEVRRAVAVMSDERLHGPYAEGQRLEGWAVMGSAKLDLARPDLPTTVDVRAVAVMGDVEVLVPPGAQVHLVGGASVMGDRKVRVSDGGSGPLVRLTAVAVMGSVSVRSSDVPTGLAAVVQRVALSTGHGRSAPVPVVAAPAPARRRRPRRGRRALVLGGLAGVLVLGSGAADGVLGDGRVAVMSGLQERVTGTETGADVNVLMGGAELVVEGGGRDAEIDARSLMGGVEVLVTGEVTRRIDIDARTMMGGVNVTVPDGTTVAMTGGMVMGGTECDGEGCGVDEATADVVVDARGAMGGVTVEFASPTEIRAELRDDSDDSDDGD